MLKERYASWDSGIGAEIEAGKHSFKTLEKFMLDRGDAAAVSSGRQELIENIINTYI